MQTDDNQQTPLLRDAALDNLLHPCDEDLDTAEYLPDVLVESDSGCGSGTTTTKAAKVPQFIASIICCLAPISFGTVLGYSSPTIGQLEMLGVLDEEKSSWHASIVTLGAVFGGLIGGVFMDKLGRKGTLIACGVPYTVGWLMIMAVGLVNSFILLLAGRFLTGVTMGVVCMTAPTYIAEIATPELRGTLGNLFQLAVTIGLVLAFALGIPLTWQWLALACAVIAACMSVAIFFIPETPLYLASKGHEAQALASLRWLRGTNYDYHLEYYSIMCTQNEQPDSGVTVKEVLTDKSLYKPILITLGLMVFQQCSGINNFLFYIEPIFESAGSSHAALSGVIIGGVQVVATLLSVFIMDIAGRRILLLISGTFMMIGCITLGLFYYLNNDTIGWLPLLSLILYVIAFSIGWGPIPWTMMAEIVPARTKGFASGLTVFANWMCAFVVTKEFPAMEAAMTKQGAFWFFAGVNITGVLFTALFVPETKGKSLTEIQQFFKRSVTYPSIERV